MKLLLELQHLQIVIDRALSECIVMEVPAILKHAVKVPFDVLEVLQGKSIFPKSVVGETTMDFVPHCLHLVNVELAVTVLATERCHNVVG